MIRYFVQGDEVRLSQIQRESIAVLGPREYDAAQVSAWLARAKSADFFLDRHAAGDTIIIAEDHKNVACGYILIEPDGHLDHAYVHPAFSGRGHATTLLSEASRWARAHEVTALYSEVSEVARPVFERAGWRVANLRDFAVDGVPIHNYAMRLDVFT